MKEFAGMMEQSLRAFFKDKINTLIFVNIIGFLIVIGLLSYNFGILEKTQRKVEYRYFNITRTLQDLFNVEIDTYKGRVVNHYDSRR